MLRSTEGYNASGSPSRQPKHVARKKMDDYQIDKKIKLLNKFYYQQIIYSTPATRFSHPPAKWLVPLLGDYSTEK